MGRFIGTFGVNHPLGKAFVVIPGEHYETARLNMTEAYGSKWGFIYESKEEAGVEQFGLKEVPFGTPNEWPGEGSK